MRIEIQPDYQPLIPLVENIEWHFQQAETILHQARNEIRVVPFEGEQYVIKAFKVPHVINRFAYRYLRDSKAKRSYDYSVRLGAELCPEAVAFREDYQSGLLTRSYFISRYFQYDYTIRPVLGDSAFNNRTQILQQFAEFTYQLHQRNILHRDYSPGNILIKQQGSEYVFKVVDVNRMQFRALSLKDRLQNFARLMVGDDVMQVMLTHYAGLIDEPEDKVLAQAIGYRNGFAQRRALKNKLRGR